MNAALSLLLTPMILIASFQQGFPLNKKNADKCAWYAGLYRIEVRKDRGGSDEEIHLLGAAFCIRLII